MAVNCLMLKMDLAIKNRMKQEEEDKQLPIEVEVAVEKVIVEEKKLN
jgi:hypothetical protein